MMASFESRPLATANSVQRCELTIFPWSDSKRLTCEATMFLINAQTQDRAYIRSLMSVKASTAFRSAPKENRVPEWKTGDAIFILAVL
jgi:hypothetical protein